MKRLGILLTLQLVLTPLLISCDQRVIEKNTVVVRETVPGGPTQTEVGGIDSGGGNSVDGRPLESFRVEMDKHDVVEEALLPLILQVHEIHENLAADFMHILHHRMWYLIPVRLETLSPLRVGVAFSIEDLGQIALQDTLEIWMDSNIFDPMAPEDKVKILIHELIMGVRIMEFSTSLDRCLARSATYLFADSDRQYRQKRDECYREHQWLGGRTTSIFDGPRIDLNDRDYKAVRTLTNLITEEMDSLSFDQLNSIVTGALKRDYPDSIE